MSESVPELAVMQSSTVDTDQKVGKGQYSHYYHGEDILVGLEASDCVTLRMEEPLGTSDLWERPGPLVPLTKRKKERKKVVQDMHNLENVRLKKHNN